METYAEELTAYHGEEICDYCGEHREASLSWGDLAEFNHAHQIAHFNFCGCEDSGTLTYADCPEKVGA